MATLTLNSPVRMCCGKPRSQCGCYDQPAANAESDPVDTVNFLPIPRTVETIVQNFGGQDCGPHSFDGTGGGHPLVDTAGDTSQYGGAPTPLTPAEMLAAMGLTDAEKAAVAAETNRRLALNSAEAGLPLPETMAQVVAANVRERATRGRSHPQPTKRPTTNASTVEGLPLPKTVETIVNERRRGNG